MNRRNFLASTTAVLALPHVARSQDAHTLRFIPQVDLPLLDPVANSAYITRSHCFTVFDTLFGQGSAYAPQPQIVACHPECALSCATTLLAGRLRATASG